MDRERLHLVCEVSWWLGNCLDGELQRRRVSVREWKDALPAARVRERLGVDALALRELVSAGIIRRLDGVAALSMKGGDAYSRSEIDRFVGTLKEKAFVLPEVLGYESLRRATNRVYRGRIPWSQIFSAIVDGRLPVFLERVNSHAALVDMLLVSDEEKLVALLVEAPIADVAVCRDRLSVGEAAGYLATSEKAVTMFINEGLLATNGSHKWKLDRAVVESFRSDYILAGEILRRYAVRYLSVRVDLFKEGVHPACPEQKRTSSGPGRRWRQRLPIDCAPALPDEPTGIVFVFAGTRSM